MTNLNNKQSNTASLQWGLNAPTNKMPVKITGALNATRIYRSGLGCC